MSSLAKMMDYEIEINKINEINDAIEMLEEKNAYYWLEILKKVNFDIMCINKIFNADIEKLKNKENDTKNVIKDIEKSILNLEDMDRNKINNIKIVINKKIKKFDVASMEEIKNLEKNKNKKSIHKEKVWHRAKNVKKWRK